MKALILEHSRLYRQVLDTVFAQQGFFVDTTDQISIARELIAGDDYQVLCLNENLQDGSGLKFARECRQNQRTANLPILFFTSENDFSEADLYFVASEVIFKQNLQQVASRVVHFIDSRMDPVFSEGRIMLVEDSKTVSTMISKSLRETSYEVKQFTTAEEAWQDFVRQESYGSDPEAYDLVITDVNLAGDMNGVDLTQNIRKLEDARSFIPIIAITADSDADLRLSLFKGGINDLILKPILHDEMLVRVANLITNKRLVDKVHDQRRELYAMATTDKLTGCSNRHSLMEFSTKLIAEATRHQIPISVIVIDLDHFKRINDSHGHAVGDVVLRETGKLLRECFREGDMVARFGGEEFIVLLNHCDALHAQVKAESLRQKIEQLNPHEISISASIGVTNLGTGMRCDYEKLFQAADEGVYQAKKSGRNRVEYIQCRELGE
jgi:two-component system cell cycle response regulator